MLTYLFCLTCLGLNHKKSATTLSEFIWKLKESKTEYHLSWDVIDRAQPYPAATNRCNLCIAEKYFILKTKPSLNKRRETFSSCPHRKKHLLQNYQWPGNEKKQQHKVGTATEHTSVIPEESGGQATPLSSAWNTSVVCREFKVRSSISILFKTIFRTLFVKSNKNHQIYLGILCRKRSLFLNDWSLHCCDPSPWRDRKYGGKAKKNE